MSENMKKVAFRNLGCKVNEYEMEYMQQRMVEKGYSFVPFDTKADIYVVNTCTVTNIADRKSRQMLHRAKKTNPDAIVVAVGCYVQTDTEGASKDSAIDILIGNNQKGRLPEIIEEYLLEREKTAAENDTNAIKSVRVIDISKESEYENMHIEKTAEHTRAFVKIQDGCNQFCSYCAIPLARGRIRSRGVEDVLSEVRDLAKNGYKEIVLTGIHLSSYGIEDKYKSYNEMARLKETNTALLNVISKVSNIDGIERIRLGSLEPRLITEDFLRELSKVDKLCPHFHLSLQSGCNETLKRMNRHYTTEEFKESVGLLRKYFNDPAITTDVIVGFPGETAEEFEITRHFLSEIGFFEMHVFKYSRRKNTVADKLPNQVSDADKDIRSDELLSLDEKMSDRFKNRYLGREVEVLFEECVDGEFIGHTREYIKVAAKGNINLCGQIRKLVLDGESLYFTSK